MGAAAAVLCVLLLLLQAGAAEKGLPLYKYIAHLAGNTKLVSSRQQDTSAQQQQHKGADAEPDSMHSSNRDS